MSGGDIATPLRELVGKQSNVQVLLGEVTNIHPESKQIAFNGKAYSYYHLVLAMIRQHVLRPRRMAHLCAADENPRARKRDPSTSTWHGTAEQTQILKRVSSADRGNVGAGPSGCEMAGAVSELMRWALNNAFKQLDSKKTRIVLVNPGDRVLRAMS